MVSVIMIENFNPDMANVCQSSDALQKNLGWKGKVIIIFIGIVLKYVERKAALASLLSIQNTEMHSCGAKPPLLS